MRQPHKEDRPVTDEEFAEMPDRIHEHFETVRDALEAALEDDE
ncbi:hypothetical protein HLRTI_003209 [Halorhabdus tiamatea SARL4B]|uniref:Uncharacterized protein n=1 Tax=Halorhabdus tiamatea SARL4B TaxID=1033806 RepID=F7PKW1_9EURY|nr:hypothetical protein [Halorhabdus tiamatea]ERJ04806.1 hypothetical protein HLRTI_003209 [Halorhabdus tiamatea SARL4B]CCQ34098.1 hypothetical protein HTIA_1981 [Halorhabdus tiamatea SARL4B]